MNQHETLNFGSPIPKWKQWKDGDRSKLLEYLYREFSEAKNEVRSCSQKVEGHVMVITEGLFLPHDTPYELEQLKKLIGFVHGIVRELPRSRVAVEDTFVNVIKELDLLIRKNAVNESA